MLPPAASPISLRVKPSHVNASSTSLNIDTNKSYTLNHIRSNSMHVSRQSQAAT